MLAPGERWHYSNLAYILLGELVAELSGMPYEDYVEQRILQPLGLTRTSFSPEEPTALAYSVEPYSDVLRREPMLVERTGGIAAAGQLWSTVGDLCRWASFLADPDPDVLSPESIDVMTAVQTMADPYRWSLAWGVGLALQRRDDRIYCGHDGGMPGYLANVLVDRSDKLGVAVLVNGETVAPAELALALVTKARERVPPEPETWRPERAAAAGARERARPLVVRGRGVRLPVARRPARGAHGGSGRRGNRGHGSSLSTATASGRSSGASAASCSGSCATRTGSVTRMYWATYPLSREPEVTGTWP